MESEHINFNLDLEPELENELENTNVIIPELDPDFESEMNKFVHQLDLEKQTSKHIVFYQISIKLNSAVTFSQYIFLEKKLITMIGELHAISWDCPGSSTTIPQYIIERVTKNNKAQIMLEYNIGDNPLNIGSSAIRDTYTALQSINKTNIITPFDSRAFFLTLKGQKELYQYNLKNYYNTPELIGINFIEPFFSKIRDDSNLFKAPYSITPEIKNYLEINRFEDLDDTFRYIASQLENKSLEQISIALMVIWQKVCDWFVLRDLLANKDTDEYIIISGRAHYNYLRTELDKIALELNYQSGDKINCVDLYGTYKFS